MTARNGSAEWHGNVESGSGAITVGNGVFEGAYSYESRFGEAAGTNPEQLLAAAHSGCFRTETRLVDRMIGAYVNWREACGLVHDAYRSWASATSPSARVAFSRYTAALDAEERAAEVYASLVRRVGHLATNDDDLSGPLAA